MDCVLIKDTHVRREPWSNGNLRFKRLWVQIPAPDSVRTFFTFICRKNGWKDKKINEKEARQRPFLKKIPSIVQVLVGIPKLGRLI